MPSKPEPYRHRAKADLKDVIWYAAIFTAIGGPLMLAFSDGNLQSWKIIIVFALQVVLNLVIGWAFALRNSKTADEIPPEIKEYQAEVQLRRSLLVSNELSLPVFEKFDSRRRLISFSDERYPYQSFTPEDVPQISYSERMAQADSINFDYFLRTEPGQQQIRIFFWTTLLKHEVSKLNLPYLVPGYSHITYGFFPASLEPGINYVFGAMLFVKEFSALYHYYPNLITSNWQRRDIQSLFTTVHIDNFRFPVFIDKYREFLHCTDPHPESGTRSCFAEPKSANSLKGLGMLTAKHVTGNRVGARIRLECGHFGYIADAGLEGIDAAFLICKKCRNQTMSPVKPKIFIPSWIDVEINFKNGYPIPAKITSVTDTGGIFNHHQLPIRICLSTHGVKGDSGALVVDKATGEAVGIYIGSYMDQAGRSGGIAQGAYQVAETMQLNFFT